ncbi:MAG: Deoxyuridine 5'-triphosphate nucleotidohydrolase [Candidatus Anoxychlamydiales bacterium]|nr:Deoxyuridine 5'-triphosphate nucleotidohydrolase [Candidatus Anoxychlamydiales bacterium]
MNRKKIFIKAKSLKCIPKYESLNASGADLKANIENDIVLKKNETALIPTGISLEIPNGLEIQIRPRSGLAYKHGITVLNTPGTIDADYRGEIKVILINHSENDFVITPFMRIAQIVLTPIYIADFEEKEMLTTTLRGGMGFGHTGKN